LNKRDEGLGVEAALLHWCLESGELVRQRRVGRDSECGIDGGVEKSEKVEVVLGVGCWFS